MPPLSSARYRAWRAILSALAGGGLTAAGLGGPVTTALGATPPTGTAEGAATSTGSEPAAPSSEAAAGQPPVVTSTTRPPPAPPAEQGTAPTNAPTPVPTKTVPARTPPAKTAPAKTVAPTVVLQRKQRNTEAKQSNPNQTTAPGASGAAPGVPAPAGSNNVAVSPQLAAGEAGALAAALASSAASVQALGFYRIPLFLLPIYKAAAVQYGVPWQILAAINEIETNYGSDQSVSTAGAVGWMQFMPETWLQYGVDALDAGYADPYNPVDAIFAAARYLRAAGAASDLHAAILAYNHSEEYVSSVLLRAKLISSYPKSVIATLTGLTDGRLPVTGKHITWAAKLSSVSSRAPRRTGTPGSTLALAPAAAAAVAAKVSAAGQALQLAEVRSAPNAHVVAVQDGRITAIGRSRRLGRYLVLRDVYGDVFTYAALGSIAQTYTLAKPSPARVKSPVVEAASTRDPAPSRAASAGNQPVTLKVKAPTHKRRAMSAGSAANSSEGTAEATSPVVGKVRLFARPGNPDAVAGAVLRRARGVGVGDRLALRRGVVVAAGTVLGRVAVVAGGGSGRLRFAVRPAGDAGTVDPRPVLASWAQLALAVHPQGAKAQNALLGATASDVLLMGSAQLERTVLSDPGVTLGACERREVAAGRVDRRVLAVLAFLSRSGLEPSVGVLRCSHPAGVSLARAVDTVDISAINGVALAGHQGAGTITDLAIRTLLTLPAAFVPHSITSLMRYPNAPSTHALPSFSDRMRLQFAPAAAPPRKPVVASSAKAGAPAPSPLLTPTYISPVQWGQLVTRIGALPAPHITTKPSPAAIPDPKRR